MRLFVAIELYSEQFKEIQDSLRNIKGKMTFPKTYHITIKFLGEVDESKIDEIKQKLVSIKFDKFSLTLDKLGVFPNENYVKVLWIGVKPHEQLKELQAKVEESLKGFNFRKDHKFHPHITIARVKFLKDKEGFKKLLKQEIKEERFVVDSFKLIKSTLEKTGPVYEDILEQLL